MSEAVARREASRRYGDCVLRNSVVEAETVWLSGGGVLSKGVAGGISTTHSSDGVLSKAGAWGRL